MTVKAETVNEQVTGVSLPVNRAALLNAAMKNAQSIFCRRCDTVIIAENMITWHDGHGRKHERRRECLFVDEQANKLVQGAGPVGEDEVNEWWRWPA